MIDSAQVPRPGQAASAASMLAGLDIDPSTLIPGVAAALATLRLSQPAPAGGIAVTLSSNAPDVARVPSSLKIDAGEVQLSFPVWINPFAADARAEISAHTQDESATLSTTTAAANRNGSGPLDLVVAASPATAELRPLETISASPAPDRASNWTIWHTLALLTSVGVMVLAGFLVPLDAAQGLTASVIWLSILAVTVLSVGIIGHGVNRRPDGVLIDSRNRISLATFQALLWTLLLVSGLIAAALVNIRLAQTNPLQIAIPQQLLLLAGLSTTSLVGSPLILNLTSAVNQGAVDRNESPDDASWADLLTGERAGNVGSVDLSRVQLFYFTLAAILAYGSAIAQVFNVVPSAATRIDALPGLDPGILGLLTLSHAGYLVTKVSQGRQAGA